MEIGNRRLHRFLSGKCAAIFLLSATLWSAKPVRIVSTTLVTDEIVTSLVEPSRIAALSNFSPEPQTSNVAEIARKVNSFVDRDAEKIVRLHPDLVISTRYSKVDLGRLIRGLDIPYVELTQFESVADIERNIRTIGHALDEDTKAEDLIRSMKGKLEAAARQTKPAKRSWRVLYLAPGEWTAGSKTSIHELIRSSGMRNAAAEAGVSGYAKISVENILRSNPDVILIGTGYQRDTDYQEILTHDSRYQTIKAIRNHRIVALPSRYVLTTSQFIGDAAVELSRRANDLPE